MRAGIVEQQEWTYRRAVDAVRKESADGKAVSNPMGAWPFNRPPSGLAAIMWFRATLGATSSKFQIRAMARASTL